MAAIRYWTKNLPAVALFICGVLFCSIQCQLSHDHNGALNEITEFNDELDPEWITEDDTPNMGPLLPAELSWGNVPLQYVKRGKSQVFQAGLFGKRNSGRWNQNQQNEEFGKRMTDWLEEYLNSNDRISSAKREWNPQQQKGGLFGKRSSEFKRTYEDILESLHDQLMDKRAGDASVGRVRTKLSGQHVFRTGGLFGKRSAEEPGMEKALWPEDEQR